MHCARTMLGIVVFCGALAAGPDISAQGGAPAAVEACLSCHDESLTLMNLHTQHAVTADSRTGLAAHGCATCHGPSEAHQRRPDRGGRRASPDIVFGDGLGQPPITQNRICLRCHQGTATMHWQGSRHETEGLACISCHRLHIVADPVLDRLTEANVCFVCHRKERAETLRPSAHPLRDGRMICSDCHDAHGSTGPMLLGAGTINESCYRCHAEMRGPFLWEHPPARENCLNCHRPHGSVHASLLRQRGPWLCQQCHLAQFHPSAALSGTGLPGEALSSGSQSMLGRNCMNCHVHVHGSNHPAGVGMTR